MVSGVGPVAATGAPGTTFNLGNASYRFVGEANNDYSGYPIASAGDVDGDGKADLLIGAPSWDVDTSSNSREGKTYLMLGSDITAAAPGTAFNLGT